MSTPLWLSIHRWAQSLLLGLFGAIIFELCLSVGWHYARSLPDPFRWFSSWFVYVAIYAFLVALAFLVAEPVKFRSRQIRYWHRYPPLWFSIVLAIVAAWMAERYLSPVRLYSVPDWRQWDIAALVAVATVAVALRQLPWRTVATRPPRPALSVPLDWDGLSRWLRREEPIDGGPDLLGHAPIAQRIFEAVNQPHNAAIALLGPIGSGKSSIINAVKTKLGSTDAIFTVVAEFNCWALPNPEDAPRLALEHAILALDQVIDVQGVQRLPLTYQRLLSAEPTGKVSRLLGLDDAHDVTEQLRRLTPLLEVLDARLLIVIEDAERAGLESGTRHLERLLWTLRRVDRVSFILAFDPNGARFAYEKLCDIVERIPPVTPDRAEDILAPAYAHWMSDSDAIIPVHEGGDKDRLGLSNVTDPTVRYMRRRSGETVSDAITTLLTSPRDIKHFIRDVDRAWSQLRGEVALDDLIVLTVLRHGATAAFDFIVKNIDLARLELREKDTFESDTAKSLGKRWETFRDSLPHPVAVQMLVDSLQLPGLSKATVRGSSSLQGIRNGEPVDYFARILAGTMSSTEIRDQDVLRDIVDWQTSRSRRMLDRLEADTPQHSPYVAAWEHFADPRLDNDELIEVTTGLVSDLLRTFGANASMEHPAMLAVWRRCNRRIQRDAKTAWLIEQIESCLPTSLWLATDLFYYWASINHGIVSEEGRAIVRGAVVAAAKARLTTVDLLLKSLGPLDSYSVTRLIYPPPTHQPPDTIPLSSWAWLVELLIPASRVAEERVVPDLAVLVIDSTSGFRSGDLIERYVLLRDKVMEIFGDRTPEVLGIFASYQGEHKHAMGAKNGAIEWLAELRQGRSAGATSPNSSD